MLRRQRAEAETAIRSRGWDSSAASARSLPHQAADRRALRRDRPRRRRARASGRVRSTSRRIDALEELLISADIGVAATDRDHRRGQGAVAQRREPARSRQAGDPRRLRRRRSCRSPSTHRPQVMLIVGVNGTGKTTTVGKLANLLKTQGRRPLICAADTFRAAAVEQLEIWATRAGVDMVRAREGADPAAVVFDAISSGKAKGRDPILVDTAGRLHTRVNLMNELEKIRRIAAREVAGRAAGSAARARRDGRAERPRAGARVHGRRRRQRHRADEARRHGEGRRRGRDRARSEAADSLRRRRRRRSTTSCRFRPRSTSNGLFEEKW